MLNDGAADADKDDEDKGDAVMADAGPSAAASSAADDEAAPYAVGPIVDDDERRWIGRTLERLSHSAFRAKFALAAKDRAYARAKGRETIDRHAHEMLRERVGAESPRNDGRQTPWRGHPVFTAQHATATCCRGCIEKWHHIPKGRALTDTEVNRLADLVMAWIERDLAAHPAPSETVGDGSRDARRSDAAGRGPGAGNAAKPHRRDAHDGMTPLF